MNIALSLLLIINLIFAFLSYFVWTNENGLIATIAYTASALLAVLYSIYAIKCYGKNNIHSKGFLLMGIGLFCWLLGELTWAYLDQVLGIYPFPSMADIAYVLAYPFLLIGFLIEIKSRNLNLSKKAKTLLLILSICFAGIISYLLIFQAFDREASFWENALGFAYGIGDLILTIIIFALLAVAIDHRKGKLATASLVLLSAMLMIIIPDIIYSIYYELYEEGGLLYGVLDLMWVAGYLLFAYYFLYMGKIVKSIQQKII